MLKAVVGIDSSYLGALIMALDDYNNDEDRKQYHETLVQTGETQIVVTILYSPVSVAPVKVQEPVFEFIGSKGIDPSDPDWKSKMDTAQNTATTSQDGS